MSNPSVPTVLPSSAPHQAALIEPLPESSAGGRYFPDHEVTHILHLFLLLLLRRLPWTLIGSVDAVNCQGLWGSGIAEAFKAKVSDH